MIAGVGSHNPKLTASLGVPVDDSEPLTELAEDAELDPDHKPSSDGTSGIMGLLDQRLLLSTKAGSASLGLARGTSSITTR
jgi:hypothetical protein